MDWFVVLTALSWFYAITNTTLALFSLNVLFLLILAIHHQHNPIQPPAYAEGEWPSVLVQLPVFNEKYVVERIIDAAAHLDYPADRLTVQVLDDSTDDTAVIAMNRAAYHRENGRRVEYLHRTRRTGYKAGALAAGMVAAPGEIIVVFDGDFIPPRDFLRRMIPEFLHRPRLGVLQARWEHYNLEQNVITRMVALGLDEHFAVDQMARSRSGLLMNFNGSGCLLRRACIIDAGGWQDDTLVEDADLSYRAQIKGWQIGYCPDVTVPGELPANILIFKQQQYRWAKGAIQVLRKLGETILKSSKSVLQKIESIIHLSGYIVSPLMLVSFLLMLPMVYMHGTTPFNMAILGFAALIPPVAVLWSQNRLRGSWLECLVYYPILFLSGIGMSVVITAAVFHGFFKKSGDFTRTPKFSAADQRQSAYALPVDWSTWVELLLTIYGLGTGILAIEKAAFLAPFIFLYTSGFALTSILGFAQASGLSPKHIKPVIELESNES